MKKSLENLLKQINKISARKEELWLSRIIPIKRNQKEIWVISLVNKKRKTDAKDILNSMKAVSKLNKNSEYWICEKKKSGKWLCTFYPKASKKPWRF